MLFDKVIIFVYLSEKNKSFVDRINIIFCVRKLVKEYNIFLRCLGISF